MCQNPFSFLKPKIPQQAPVADAPAQAQASSVDASLLKRRARSLLGTAGAVGDTSGAMISTGGALGKTQLGG